VLNSIPNLEIIGSVELPCFGLKTARTGLVWSTTDLFGATVTGLVWPVPDLSGTQQFCFQNLVLTSPLVTSYQCHTIYLSFISYLRMDPRCEKRTKQRQDVAGTSKRGRSSKVLEGRHPPPPRHHPSHSGEEDDDRELLKHHTPFECSSHLAIYNSKKLKQRTINDNREAPVYEGSKQSHDPRFWSLFHSDWYQSIYLHKKKPVVETQWVNWD
jgi:hypothetical protein